MLESQGHSERRVILMMILMGSNGGRKVSAQTNPSLIKITLQAKTVTHIHTLMHEGMQQKTDPQKKFSFLGTIHTHKHTQIAAILSVN